ncbi:hypothetical protein CF319_g8501 [Tilletia indica]|nr:hypothetical protein CF327_g4737 [Tilletia walkeri]KAE8217403.1 hypothetical protein CF319_g8501 [Tilletia indica]
MEVVTSLGLLEEVVVTILSWLKKKILDINALLIFYSAAPLAHHISSLAAAQSFGNTPPNFPALYEWPFSVRCSGLMLVGSPQATS